MALPAFWNDGWFDFISILIGILASLSSTALEVLLWILVFVLTTFLFAHVYWGLI